MSQNQPRNVAASVLQKLRDRARLQQENADVVQTRYALERLLYRLSQSQHRDQFILKGAMVFSVWSDELHRATRDLDLQRTRRKYGFSSGASLSGDLSRTG